MRLRLAAFTLVAMLVTCGWWAATSSKAENQTPSNVGKKIPNIAFTDASGKITNLHDFKDKKAIVLAFLSFECPVSNSYVQPLSEIANELASQDVVFIGLTENQDETPAAVALHAKEWKLSFPLHLDRKFAAADAVEAKITPEVFVLDGDFVLRYRGRIDNTYYARLKKGNETTEYDLRQALAELVSGRPVTTPMTDAIGCAIVRTAPEQPKLVNVTYHKDVLPILQRNCQECHRPGAVGPFSLMNYKQAVNWAVDIKDYTHSKQMPPWKISEGVPFLNERKLSAHELAVLAAWADNGTPEGDPKDAPAPVTFTDGWTLGTPDLVLEVSDEYQVGPIGNDIFRCFVLPTNLGEDKYVAAIEVRPGNPKVVHHALLFIDQKGIGRKLEKDQLNKPAKDLHGGTELDKGPGYFSGMGVGFIPTSTLGGWAPGQRPRTLPDGTGTLLPKDSDVVMQLHYHRTGRLEKDRTSIGIYYSKKPVDKPYQGGVMAGIFLFVPAGNERFVVKGTGQVNDDMVLDAIMPHMHMLGKQIKVTATAPDGKQSLLFDIKKWDYNWQESYYFKDPLPLKSGTRLDLEAIYDNSANNPSNPFSPPRVVTFGEQTFDEMCFVFLGGTSSRKGAALPVSIGARKAK